jgi:glycosyltransferase involved in cell wall biosynthesis
LDKQFQIGQMIENDSMELSVVVLCYQSGELIRSFVHQLNNEIDPLGIIYELILVANYDSDLEDTTAVIASNIAEQYKVCRVIAKSKEGKMGWDMRSGIDASKGRYIAVIDGDGQMPVSDVPTVYKIIAGGNFDLVKTFRANRFDGLYRTVLSRIYNLIFSLLFHPDFPVRDINSKPKIFTRDAISKMNLRSNDWFTDAEIMIEANRLKLRICDIATVFYRNERRPSFVRPSTIFEFIFNLLYYRMKLR